MLSQVTFLPNISYEFRIKDGQGDIKLLDETGQNVLLFIGMKPEKIPIILNTCIDGMWGVEVDIKHPPADDSEHGVIFLKFDGRSLEASTKEGLHVFDRFDLESANRVCFMELCNAEHPRDTMCLKVLSPDAMKFEISQYIIHQRLNQIEKLMNMQNPK